jgi:hypothetical protein
MLCAELKNKLKKNPFDFHDGSNYTPPSLEGRLGSTARRLGPRGDGRRLAAQPRGVKDLSLSNQAKRKAPPQRWRGAEKARETRRRSRRG